jgi:hypothetical protein
MIGDSMTEDDIRSLGGGGEGSGGGGGGGGLYGLKTPCNHCFHVKCLTHWAALSIVQKENKVPSASWITEQGRTQTSIKNLHGQLKSAELELKNLLEQKEKCDLEIEENKVELARACQCEADDKVPIKKKEKDSLKKEKEDNKTKIVERKSLEKKKKKEETAIEEIGTGTEIDVGIGVGIGIASEPKELQKLLEKLRIQSNNCSDKMKRMEKR